MNSLWLAVATTCLRKDWFGYAVFLGVGIVGYPDLSVLLIVGCLAVLAIVAAVRIIVTYFHIRHRIEEIPGDLRAEQAGDLSRFCDVHIRGVFG